MLQLDDHEQRIAALEQKVADLAGLVVGKLPCESAAASNGSIPDEVRQKLLSLAQDLFPGPAAIQSDRDPEFPDHAFWVISVQAKGDVREIVDRECEWHKKAATLTAVDVRLSIDPT
jgi:hypothetical protein